MRAVANVFWMSVWGTVLLAGCANPQSMPGASSGNQNDFITDSDEPDSRRRARLRVELATGYFEQGQTKVALDEIKQALATDPSYVEAYNLRGLVYMRLNDVPLAEDSFRRALALNARDANVAHNYGWLLCQQARYAESFRFFAQAAANPTYTGKAKTLMTQGVCQVNAGQLAEAEQSLMHSYELDAGNPVTGYNLANLLYVRGDLTRAQFYIRRINNSDLANAETLWLGIRTERKLNNQEAVLQLAQQLRNRFAQSAQAGAYEKGLFNE
jgi:type IV pilus assembly protein PilF